MKKLPSIVITGASGFIGSYIIDYLKEEYIIFVIARRSRKAANIPYHPNLQWLQCDISKVNIVEESADYVMENGGADFIIHLAELYDFTYTTRAPLPVITGTASTAVGEFFVAIREIKAPGSLTNKQVILTNLSGQVNMAGWTMTDGEGNQFTFPALSLLSRGEVTVHTGRGTNTPTDLYWGQTQPRWASGKVAYLRDPNGKLIATYQVP